MHPTRNLKQLDGHLKHTKKHNTDFLKIIIHQGIDVGGWCKCGAVVMLQFCILDYWDYQPTEILQTLYGPTSALECSFSILDALYYPFTHEYAQVVLQLIQISKNGGILKITSFN